MQKTLENISKLREKWKETHRYIKEISKITKVLELYFFKIIKIKFII